MPFTFDTSKTGFWPQMARLERWCRDVDSFLATVPTDGRRPNACAAARVTGQELLDRLEVIHADARAAESRALKDPTWPAGWTRAQRDARSNPIRARFLPLQRALAALSVASGVATSQPSAQPKPGRPTGGWGWTGQAGGRGL